MKKEIVIVIIIGILIGCIIAFGIYTAQSALKNKPSQVTQSSTDNQTSEPIQHSLKITEPEDEIVTDQDKITVAGKTTPQAVIAIIASENEYLFIADSDGQFSAEVDLEGGVNQLTISSFDTQGNKSETTLTVVYSTADI